MVNGDDNDGDDDDNDNEDDDDDCVGGDDVDDDNNDASLGGNFQHWMLDILFESMTSLKTHPSSVWGK